VLEAFESGASDFGQLFYDYLIRVIDRTLQSVLGERACEHDDLVQGAFEKLLVTLAEGTFRRECSLKAWAAVVTTRVGLNAIRSRQTMRRYFPRSIDDSGSFLLEPKRCQQGQLEGRALLRVVREELSRMRHERAEALVLADVLGHDIKEVADELNVSTAAAQSRIVRGRSELRRRLERRGMFQGEGEAG
jgi:RNA polymerase sigma-70 factor (ECF subfamily)